jgi:hypothetical protein
LKIGQLRSSLPARSGSDFARDDEVPSRPDRRGKTLRQKASRLAEVRIMNRQPISACDQRFGEPYRGARTNVVVILLEGQPDE